jgi:hypothetical protein
MTQHTDPLAGSLADVIEHGEPADLPIPAEAEPMISTSIRLPVELLEWAKNEAHRRGLSSWSTLVRQLIDTERTAVDEDAVVSVAELNQFLSQRAHRSSAA